MHLSYNAYHVHKDAYYAQIPTLAKNVHKIFTNTLALVDNPNVQVDTSLMWTYNNVWVVKITVYYAQLRTNAVNAKLVFIFLMDYVLEIVRIPTMLNSWLAIASNAKLIVYHVFPKIIVSIVSHLIFYLIKNVFILVLKDISKILLVISVYHVALIVLIAITIIARIAWRATICIMDNV